jgi:hypothetical protein
MRNMDYIEINKTFRFDDVCINSDMELLNSLTDFLFAKIPDCEVMWAISPAVVQMERYLQRVFPKKWNALSDNTVHYKLDKVGVPKIHPRVTVATHGLVHADHRLMDTGAQELSIVLSKSLIDIEAKHFCEHFVPPFNKWNFDTEIICREREINLVKFEDGWRSMEFEKWNDHHHMWYLHAREWTLESLKKWFEK